MNVESVVVHVGSSDAAEVDPSSPGRASASVLLPGHGRDPPAHLRYERGRRQRVSVDVGRACHCVSARKLSTGAARVQPVAALGLVFRLLASARDGRAVHKVGRTFSATFTSQGRAGSGIALFDRPGIYPALVRLSRGAGLPSRWPDVLGVAVRVHDGSTIGYDLDLLVSSTLGRAPLARHVPFPRRAITTTYTSIASYRTPRGRRLLAVFPARTTSSFRNLDTVETAARAERGRLVVATASRFGRWRIAGRIDLDEPTPTDVDRQLSFDPLMRSVPDLAAEGLLWRVRAAAYRESRRGREAAPTPPPANTEAGQRR